MGRPTVTRLRRQDGSTLVMVIGVIAALAIMASSLVLITVNSQHSTSLDRKDKLAFDVAEAGIDLGQNQLYKAWPTSSSPAAPLGTGSFTTDTNAPFADSTKYPISSAQVAFMDDANPSLSYDDGNGLMYMRSTATVGGRTATVQVEVQQVLFPLGVRDKTALYTQGQLFVNGQGSNSPVGLDPPATYADSFADSFDSDPKNYTGFPATQTALDQSGSLEPNDIVPDKTLLALIDLAYVYPTSPDWAIAAPKKPHIIVVESSVVFDGNESLWTPTDPGILIVHGDVTFRGSTSIWGIVYCDNAFGGTGTPDIHGMVVAIGSADLRGDRAVNYNPTVIALLNNMIVQTVRVVPNTWRQVGAN